jgi:hypothetical protein
MALPVHGGRVMNGEEDGQDVGKADPGGVESHLHHFGMAGVARTDGFVGGVLHMSAGVAGLHRSHPAHIQENRFRAPEAAAAQRDHLG